MASRKIRFLKIYSLILFPPALNVRFCFRRRLRRFQDVAHLPRVPQSENRQFNGSWRAIAQATKQIHARNSELFMELDLRHSELFADPVHLSAIHIAILWPNWPDVHGSYFEATTKGILKILIQETKRLCTTRRFVLSVDSAFKKATMAYLVLWNSGGASFSEARLPSGHFLMGTSGVVENVDIINDDVLPATEPRCDTYIHVFCDLFPGEVACDHGPFAQPRIDNLIELRDRKVTGSFGADIIECHKPVIANGVHNLIVTVPEMVDYLTPSDESAASAQAGSCFRVDMDRRMGLEEPGDTTGKVGLSRAAPSEEGKPSRGRANPHFTDIILGGAEHLAQLLFPKGFEPEIELNRGFCIGWYHSIRWSCQCFDFLL